jgi:hypothetical protein
LYISVFVGQTNKQTNKQTIHIYILVDISIVMCSVRSIIWFEKVYPLPKSTEASKLSDQVNTDQAIAPNEGEEEDESSAMTSNHHQQQNNTNTNNTQSSDSSTTVPPPLWLDRIMAVIYPGSLGVDEGIAHLTMKASVRALCSFC